MLSKKNIKVGKNKIYIFFILVINFLFFSLSSNSNDDLEGKLTELKGSYSKFNSDMTDNNLDDLRDKWLLSYKAWQHVEMYDIGKAMEDYYAFKGNVYPVDTVRVKINIEKYLKFFLIFVV